MTEPSHTVRQDFSDIFILKTSIFGLSKERPILGNHAKAHIHEIRRISYGFRADFT